MYKVCISVKNHKLMEYYLDNYFWLVRVGKIDQGN